MRQVFQRARNSAPCVIFFDEIDALCPKRSGTSEVRGGLIFCIQLKYFTFLFDLSGLWEYFLLYPRLNFFSSSFLRC